MKQSNVIKGTLAVVALVAALVVGVAVHMHSVGSPTAGHSTQNTAKTATETTAKTAESITADYPGYSSVEEGVKAAGLVVTGVPLDSRERILYPEIDFTSGTPETNPQYGLTEDDIDMDIKDEELKIDTYRSSGKGGQHVNKTESAVRITHLPTGIVVACQNERSQFKNKASAMKILKSRIYEKLLDQKRAEMDRFYGEKGEISWGNQIRSYVFQPYQLVKDLRTGAETGNLQAVMDGDLDMFVNAWLRAGMPTARNKNYAADTEE